MESCIQRFREKLEKAYNIIKEEPGDEFLKGSRAALQNILADFNIIFPKEIWDNKKNTKKLKKLIKKYCYRKVNKCPICGESMVLRKTKTGNSFFGCQYFPTCRGSRFKDGRITINDYLLEYLTNRYFQDNPPIKKEKKNRFKNIDL